MVTVGFDLHKRYITACPLDALGNVLAECRRLDASIDAIAAWLGEEGEQVCSSGRVPQPTIGWATSRREGIAS